MSSALILDFAVIGVTLILGVGGIISGLIKEGFGLAGILIGVYLSTSNAENVASLIKTYIYASENDLLLNLVGFALCLLVVWVAFIVAGKIVSKLAALSGLGLIDKIMGFIFAAGKIFIVFSILASCINAVPFLNQRVQNYFEGSIMFPILVSTGSAIANVEAVQASIEKAKEASKNLSEEGK